MDRKLNILVLLTFGIAFFLGVENGGFQLVLLKVAEKFTLDPVMMGAVVTSHFIAIATGPLLFGWVSDRIGKKKVLLFGMLLFITGCFGAAVSPTAAFFAAAVFVMGLGFSISECIGSTLLSDCFPGREGAYLNFMQSGFSLGAVLSPLIFSRLLLAGLVTWNAVFFSAGAGYILIFPLLLLFRDTRPHSGGAELQKTVSASIPTPGIISPFFMVLIFCIMANVAIEAGIGFFADSLFVTEYGNTELGAYAISGFWFFMTISRFTFSKVKIRPETIVLTGFLLVCLILLIVLPLKNPYVLLAAFFLLGVATGPTWPMIIGIGASLNQKRSGANTSILYASGGFGGIIIPVLIGLVAERQGFYRSFWLLPIISALGFIMMLLWKRKP